MHACMHVCMQSFNVCVEAYHTLRVTTCGGFRAQLVYIYVCIYACIHFLTGEGAGVLVLEEEGHARARGATILAELRSVGLSSDGHYIRVNLGGKHIGGAYDTYTG